LYGAGSELVGDLGTVLGWPIFLSLMIVTSNIVGIMTGMTGSATRLYRLAPYASLTRISTGALLMSSPFKLASLFFPR
jgi:hypothetical protein